jgi:small subunit ribosomal protein S5
MKGPPRFHSATVATDDDSHSILLRCRIPPAGKNPLLLLLSAAAAMAAAVARSRAAAAWVRLLSLRPHSLAGSTALPRHGHHLGSRITPPRRHLAFSASSGDARPHQKFQSEWVVHELLAEVERERQRERQDRRAKDGKDQEEEPEEDEEDYMGVKPLIEKLERRKTKDMAAGEGFWEPTDSDSDEDDERYTPDAIKQRVDEFERKCKRHEEFLQSFAEAGNEPTYQPHLIPSSIHFRLVYSFNNSLSFAAMAKCDRHPRRGSQMDDQNQQL